MSKIVISTLSCDQEFPLVVKRFADGNMVRNDVQRSVVILGMANVIDAKGFQTLGSRATEISDEEAELLAQCPAFKEQAEAGFLRILGMGENEDKAVESMAEKDKSAQLTSEDFDDVASVAERAGAEVKVNRKALRKKRR